MNRGWALAVLHQAAEAARVDGHFAESVIHGLDIGAERYGESDYQGRDNAEGGLFEARDVAAYALMEWDDMDADLAAGAPAENIEAARMFLGRAIQLAAEVDMCLRVARRERAGARAAKHLPALRRQTKGAAP